MSYHHVVATACTTYATTGACVCLYTRFARHSFLFSFVPLDRPKTSQHHTAPTSNNMIIILIRSFHAWNQFLVKLQRHKSTAAKFVNFIVGCQSISMVRAIIKSLVL